MEIMLNMLRATNLAPKISAYPNMVGQHDCNKVLLELMGCAVLMNNKPEIQKLWHKHAVDGFMKAHPESFQMFSNMGQRNMKCTDCK